jgi:carboxypeptidase family protein/TonB-dependent receptor-like protein
MRAFRSVVVQVVLVVCLGSVSPRSVLAQTNGTLRGSVCDDAGAPLPGVRIVASSQREGVTGRDALTDTSGVFKIVALPAASDYAVNATCPGFATTDLPDVEVRAGRTTTIRFVLKSATALRERVEVRATPQIVNLESTTTETRLTSEVIDLLPVLGRDYQDMLTLAPGVTDVDGDGNPNIHGARDTDVGTLVDGVSTTDPLTGKIGAQLNIESIQEIEVKTTGATAEFSRAQGGFANIITKSGGNDFRGTFKFFWRGSVLDGDGAGIDDPRLHAGVGENGLRDLTFNDFLPFLSLEGPIVRDKAWFFAAFEYVQQQTPVNAISTAFISGTQEFRAFGKATWQANASNRLALSVNYDPQKHLNQGLNSFTREETGFTDLAGGTILTARGTSILSPAAALETSLSWFDERPARVPTTGPDTNRNGVLFYDKNGDGFPQLTERDGGDDRDGDGVFDVWEPVYHIDGRNVWVDVDGDGIRTAPGYCDGRTREDTNCNGILDPGEDRNRNGRLDDTPRPTSRYPYGHLKPEAPDRDYTIDAGAGIISGPFYEDSADTRTRATLRQDLSVFVPDFKGSHDLKFGYSFEREGFGSDISPREIMQQYVPPNFGSGTTPPDPASGRWPRCPSNDPTKKCPAPIQVSALLPAEQQVHTSASGLTMGLYVQDNYKPRPNLSLGLGLRFDRERTDSSGYSSFDPAPERVLFDRLNALSGAEAVTGDVIYGDDNGIVSLGFRGDPMLQGSAAGTAMTDSLIKGVRSAMPGLFFRHHADVTFGSAALSNLIPEILAGGQVTGASMRAFGIPVEDPESLVLTNNNLAPRLSVAWDPMADGRTKLFATWGRYFDKLFLSTVVGEEGPDWLSRYYQFDNTPAFNKVEYDKSLGDAVSKSPPSTVQVDRGLQTPFSDELTLGFERELAPEMALSVTYVDRHYRNQLQDVDVNHYVKRNSITGDLLDAIGAIETFIATSDDGGRIATLHRRMPDGRPDLYISNPYFNQILRIGNYNESRYKGIVLELKRRLARRWQFQTSYTYSRAVGDAEDYQSRLGNDPSTTEFERGYLSYDQRHVVKFNAVTYLPHDWQVGTSMTWASGLPYSVISRFFAFDNLDYEQYRTRFGYTNLQSGSDYGRFVPVRRNSLRNDATLNIDVHTRKSLVIGHTSAALFLDVFNLLNRDDLRIYTYEPTPANARLNAQNADPTVGPLAINAERRFGRRFQFGMQFEF